MTTSCCGPCLLRADEGQRCADRGITGGSEHPKGPAMSGTDIARSPKRREAGWRATAILRYK
eukprot:5446329-Pleurochrysis_carterae.AAC.2